MTDPESLSLTTESSIDHESKDTQGSSSDISGTSVPLAVVLSSHQAGYFRAQQKVLPQLPSQKFQYSVWHNLKDATVKGDELKAPRVRKAPDDLDSMFHKVTDEEGHYVHHSMQGSEMNKYRDNMENWDTAKFVSITYQELQDKYQKANLQRIIGRLRDVVHLNLMHNNITSLAQHTLRKCEYLNLNYNYIYSFKNLPSIPRVRYLALANNDVMDLAGLKRLRSSDIEELVLSGNSVTFTSGYRHRVFQILPKLKVLDGIPRLNSDDESVPDDYKDPSSTCSIS